MKSGRPDAAAGSSLRIHSEKESHTVRRRQRLVLAAETHMSGRGALKRLPQFGFVLVVRHDAVRGGETTPNEKESESKTT